MLEARLDVGGREVVRSLTHGGNVIERPWSWIVEHGTSAVLTLVARPSGSGRPCVGIGLDSSLEAVMAVAGCVATNTRFVMLPARRPGVSADSHRRMIEHRAMGAGVSHALLPERETQRRTSPGSPVTMSAQELFTSRRGAGDAAAHGIDAEGFSLVQFTSGTSGDPRPVEVRGEQLLANLRSIVSRRELQAGNENYVSWLPLSHDMGLVAMVLLPLLFGGQLTIFSPFQFMRAPGTWMDAVSRYRGTFTAGPSFAFGYAAKRSGRSGRNLSSLQTLVNAGERISLRDAELFVRRFSDEGLVASSVAGCYGMAENTVAVTAPHPRTGLCEANLDVPRQAAGGSQSSRRHALLGSAICGTSVSVDQDSVVDDPELQGLGLGEVVVQGTSRAVPYDSDGRTRCGGTTQSAAFRSGDLGGLVDGQLFVAGRLGDVLTVRGRKYLAEDLESAAMTVPGVKPGHVAAVLHEGSEICVVVTTDGAAPAGLARQVRAAIIAEHGVRPDVLIVADLKLPRTTSGKLQRGLVRQWVVSES